MEANKVIQTKELHKYFEKPVRNHVLKGLSFEVDRGEFVSIVGKSGCGKSTLLYILSTMDTDYEGDLWFDGELMSDRTRAELAQIRNEKIGFVFQFHYLLSEFSVIQNVMLPGMKLGKLSESQLKKKAGELLERLDISSEADKRANQISGGQKQRVAIARALINDPLIIMGDEPTGNLDSKNSEIVFKIFRELADERGQSLLIVTHDQDMAERTDRIITMDDGHIV